MGGRTQSPDNRTCTITALIGRFPIASRNPEDNLCEDLSQSHGAGIKNLIKPELSFLSVTSNKRREIGAAGCYKTQECS